ncbi:TonB-dependent receptor-like protein [Sphingomonas sp. F9_3S_D5_B_2]
MTVLPRLRLSLLAGTATILAAPLSAQTPVPTSDPAVVPPPQAANGVTKRVYTPADFARFAPRTAYDMLIQLPSFTIRAADPTERGLGQATENVLINGERINNKNYAGGDAGAVDELHRIPAKNVERVEIVDAAALGIAGLSGQVANFIVRSEKKSSGQFDWNPQIRAHYAKPRFFRGSVSYSGTTGPVDYTLSVRDQAGRGAYGGPVLIYDRNHVLIESRHETLHNESDLVTFQGKFKLDGPGSSVGDLTLAYTPYWNPGYQADQRFLVSGETGGRTIKTTLKGWYYDVNADYEFALGPGRLKLIGLQHRDHEPLVQTQIAHFSGLPDPDGVRFSRNSVIEERIGRAEYGWKGGKNDWQVSFERAFNSLDQKGGLFILDPSGDFNEVPYPQGTGHVTEVRYEGIGTLSRPLGTKLDLQVAAGAEASTLDRVDDDQPGRKFFRPKGSISLGWRPVDGWDASLKLRRRVGQISFYDFLSQPKFSEDRENAGNPDLVPPQSWEVEGEVGHELGKWGKTRLRAWAHKVEDIVDVIPLADHTEGVGNLPHATLYGAESTSTINFDPIGWVGAKVDAQLGFEKTSVRDPLTGEKRPISGLRDRWASFSLRHDIPHTQLAWGAEASYEHYTRSFYLTEVSRSWEGPVFLDLYVEDKDVMGLDVRATISNVLNARHRWVRRVYQDWRDNSPIAFFQNNNQLIGPIFTLQVKGSF